MDTFTHSHVRLCCLLYFFLSMTTANFAISDSDGSTFLLYSALTRVYLHPESFCFGFTTAVDMLPRTGQDQFRITSMNALAYATAYKVPQVRVLLLCRFIPIRKATNSGRTLFSNESTHFLQELSPTMARHAVSEPGPLPYRYSPPWFYPINFLIIQHH